jgi:ClpP class serine protease
MEARKIIAAGGIIGKPTCRNCDGRRMINGAGMKSYPAILGTLFNTLHCILPSKLEDIATFVESAAAGTLVAMEPPEQRQPYCLSADGRDVSVSDITSAGPGYVAVLPLFGTMFQHGSMEMNASGGTSTEQFGRQFSALNASPAVKTIVIEAHTPGGQVWGTEELSNLIYAARGRTRVVTIVNSQMASAGLWVGTAAEQVFITPGGEMGSVGVVSMHVDVSQSEEKRGIKRTLIATPDKKIAGHPWAPLDSETAVEWHSKIEGTMDRFVNALARNRRVSTDHVRAKFGGGGMLTSRQAVNARMADGVATLNEVLGGEIRRLKGGTGGGNARANARQLELAEAECDLLSGGI